MSRFLAIFVGFVVSLVGGIHAAHAAVLYPYSSEATVQNNGTATVELRLDTEGVIINAAEVTLRFDPDVLRLSGLTTGGSVISLWAEAPKESSRGVITLAGGIPNGAVVKGGNLLTMTFDVIGLGRTALQIDHNASGVYLDDGKGTKDVLRTDTLELTVQSSSFGPQVYSPTMPFESRWYPASTFTAQWTVFPGALVSYAISPELFVTPDGVPEENSGTATFPNLSDGIWYFTLAEQMSMDVWSPVTRRAVRIDTVPPKPFEVSVSKEHERTVVSFATTDDTSGVQRYVARIERRRLMVPWRTLVEERVVNGSFALESAKGVSKIVVRAVDAAGNERAATWHSPRFEDGTRVLILMTLSLIVGLSGILYLIVTERTGRRAGNRVRLR